MKRFWQARFCLPKKNCQKSKVENGFRSHVFAKADYLYRLENLEHTGTLFVGGSQHPFRFFRLYEKSTPSGPAAVVSVRRGLYDSAAHALSLCPLPNAGNRSGGTFFLR